MNTRFHPQSLCVLPARYLRCAAWLSIFALSLTFSGSHPQAAADDDVTQADTFQPSEAVKTALMPLFDSISKADGSRANVELTVETVMHGEILSREPSSFAIASKSPDHHTIYHQSEGESKRIYADGKTYIVALSPQAYYELPDVLSNQAIVTSSPINLGAYPEPLLALTLAGVDPTISFFNGMFSVEAMGKTKFRGRTDSVHVRGQQDDNVVWDLWITDEQHPRPLRLLVNLTPMLQASDQVHVPEGYGLSLRYDFVKWRVTGEVEDKLFHFVPAPDATQYASLADYEEQTSPEIGSHPLLGKPVPEYTLTLLDGTEVSSEELKDKIVVLDFWATWCTPCMQAMPTIKSSVAEFADKDVVFYAINAGENASLVNGFASEQDWGVDVAVDPEGTLMDAFSAEEIPLTLIVGRNGIVESTHMGYPGEDALAKQFHDELDVLVRGGRIASSQPE
ncbi:redoxin domain-containing protein [Allorhodopirellula heiligendammensis]|uniref:Thiol-disulfide oxidoreductase ResA n=1 Tax=Allorhodopirellula heiligendammensis TaxID=2714739 RepID=A0A5C6C035_9BACT|nr:redoxin domain-containing protein [Allorhodopirellula heiligendammensis]TWU17940.1 Thiol-disulfide oxidoreductase ResA [Allorhodopirellula heiligendammensis]